MYADFAFYTDSYYGTKISEGQFNYYAQKASDFLASAFDTEDANAETLAKACCACAEVYFSEYESSENISSEKVGDYSVTYAAKESRGTSSLTNSLFRAALVYFPAVGWC